MEQLQNGCHLNPNHHKAGITPKLHRDVLLTKALRTGDIGAMSSQTVIQSHKVRRTYNTRLRRKKHKIAIRKILGVRRVILRRKNKTQVLQIYLKVSCWRNARKRPNKTWRLLNCSSVYEETPHPMHSQAQMITTRTRLNTEGLKATYQLSVLILSYLRNLVAPSKRLRKARNM